MCTSQVESGEYQHIAEQLRAVNLTYVKEVMLWQNEFAPSNDAPQAKVLRASLTVLRALSCGPEKVSLVDWAAVPAVVSELRGLPTWQCTLFFSCSLPIYAGQRP